MTPVPLNLPLDTGLTHDLPDLLADLLRDGQVYAARDPDSQLRFIAAEYAHRAAEALPVADVLRELLAGND